MLKAQVLAAYLLVSNYRLLRLEGEAGTRRVFVFEASATDATKFYQGATVPARSYSHALRDLKGMVYNR